MSADIFIERLSLAQISDDLAPRPDESISDLDRVTALGFAPRLGSLLLRLKNTNDAVCYNPALEMLIGRLMWQGRRQKWSGGRDNWRYKRVATESISFYLRDWCKTCEGRGQLAHSYSGPQDEDAGTICTSCGGSAKAYRDVPKRAGTIFEHGDIPQRLEQMLDAADAILGRALIAASGISRSKLYGN